MLLTYTLAGYTSHLFKSRRMFSLPHPKERKSMGDSLAFGYQPDLNYSHGYVDDFFVTVLRMWRTWDALAKRV